MRKPSQAKQNMNAFTRIYVKKRANTTRYCLNMQNVQSNKIILR